jgi:hypothetical protein
MSCRFSLEHKGKPYPRTCPTCKLGKCEQGFRQVAIKEWANVPHKPKYVILDGKGFTPHGFAAEYYDNGIPASILIAQGKHPADVADAEHAPPATEQTALEYGPEGCNVAMRKNGIVPPLTCKLCTKSNGGPLKQSSAEQARGCLYFEHDTAFGFVPKGSVTREVIAPAAKPLVYDYTEVNGPATCMVDRLRRNKPPINGEPCTACGGSIGGCKHYNLETTPLGSHDGRWVPVVGTTSEGDADGWTRPKPTAADVEAIIKRSMRYGQAQEGCTKVKRLSRVQIALVSDIVEEINNETTPLSEQAIRAYVDKIWDVIDKPNG